MMKGNGETLYHRGRGANRGKKFYGMCLGVPREVGREGVWEGEAGRADVSMEAILFSENQNIKEHF